MSNFDTLSLVSQAAVGTAPAIFVASTVDNLSTITATGYLNDIKKKIKANDRFFINYSDTSSFPLYTGEASTFAEFIVVYSGGNWSLSSTVTTYGQNFASVAITAAQFNGMYAAPVQLITAPGANKLLVLDRLVLPMTYGTAQFAAGGAVLVQYDSTVHGAGVAASNTEQATDFTGASASTTFVFNNASGNSSQRAFSTTVNKGLYLSNASAAFTTGDSTFVANVFYHIVATV